jgi:hypothetical protein
MGRGCARDKKNEFSAVHAAFAFEGRTKLAFENTTAILGRTEAGQHVWHNSI